MKAWLWAIFGLILFILLGLLNQAHLEKETRQLTVKLQTVATAIQMNHWRGAGRELNSVQTKWRHMKPSWSMLLHHREIDEIDQALVRTERAIQSREFPTAYVEQGTLAYYIEHIPQRERFRLVNIL